MAHISCIGVDLPHITYPSSQHFSRFQKVLQVSSSEAKPGGGGGSAVHMQRGQAVQHQCYG